MVFPSDKNLKRIENMAANAERVTLEYMSGLMEATTFMVGRHVFDAGFARGSNLIGIGAATLGRLHKKGHVSRVPELNAWQITRAGRATLA